MSKKDVPQQQQRISRNDRFAQMSHQEKIIEQKKKEILAKLEAKRKETESSTQNDKSKTSAQEEKKNPLNVFNNDGSFLSTFKSIRDKRLDSKLKSFKYKDYSGEDKNGKFSKWGKIQISPHKDRSKPRISRFSDKNPSFEQQKITINTSFNNNSTIPPSFAFNPLHLDVKIPAQNMTGQALLKNEIVCVEPNYQQPAPHQVQNPTVQSSEQLQVIVSQPVLLSMTPQLPTHNLIVSTSDTINIQPVTIENVQPVTLDNLAMVSNRISVTPQNNLQGLPTVELANIPPPNPIQVQNIPQPEPLNAMNIPQPAPIQVQNIPTPASLQLNKIPNPKPLDLMAIPTPGDGKLADTDFLQNIPPPNKSMPPPNGVGGENSINMPPPTPRNCVSVMNVQQAQPSTQSILVHTIQPVPQPNNSFTPVISVALPPGIVPSSAITVPNTIPALMAQPILPPPGITLNSVNMNCSTPLLTLGNSTVQLQTPPPSTGLVGQPLPPPTGLGNHHHQLLSVPPPSAVINTISLNLDMNTGTADYEAMASLARMVAECGPGIQDVVQQRKKQDPSLWFLFQKESAAYKQYLQLIERFKDEVKAESARKEYKPEELYEPESSCDDDNSNNRTKRKRKSRWGEKDSSSPAAIVLTPPVIPLVPSLNQHGTVGMLNKITRTDPALLQYARQTFGSTNLSEKEWKKAEDHFKINLLYQDMLKKRQELERLQQAGRNKYEYDSDEETEGGTWEHKLREKEMTATQLWAEELNRQAEGKHHIGDFLPPEEFKRFMEKNNGAKDDKELNFSDYKEFKIKEDNIGFKMLQKLGWTEGSGLGADGQGIVEPVNKAANKDPHQGLGSREDFNNDDEFESYRRRMMLAYRFRPNPLNNPRRPYY